MQSNTLTLNRNIFSCKRLLRTLSNPALNVSSDGTLPSSVIQTTSVWILSFHGVKFFSNRLLQRRFPAESQVPMENCALVWASLFVGPQILSGACCSTGSPCGYKFFQDTSTYFDVKFSTNCRWMSATGAQSTSAWSSPQNAGKSLFWCLDQLLPLLLHWPQCLQRCFSLIFSSSCCCEIFHFFLNMYPRGTTTVTDLLGLGQWQLYLSDVCLIRGKFLPAFHTCSPTYCQNLASQMQYRGL